METNEAGTSVRKEVPLHSVIGDNQKEFKITFPSLSALFTELKLMHLDRAQFNSGAPMSMQTMSMSVRDVRTIMLKDPDGCARTLTALDSASQKELKLRILRRLYSNTSTPKNGENLYMFLQRVSHRDESAQAGTRFATKFEKARGTTKKKKRTRKSSKHQEKLEKDKWLGEEKVEEEDLTYFLEQGEIWGDDVEIEDLVRIAQIEDLEKIIENDGNTEIDMFEFGEKEVAALNSLEESAERVRVLRELGEGTTVSVGKECKELCCNCEMFNRWRICRHVIWIEVVHFGKLPSGDISDAEDDWASIRQNILDLIEATHVDVSSIV